MSADSGIKILQGKHIQLPNKELNIDRLNEIERFLIQNPEATISFRDINLIKSFLDKNEIKGTYPQIDKLVLRIRTSKNQYKNQWRTLKKAIKSGLTPDLVDTPKKDLFATLYREGTTYIDFKESYLKDLTSEKLRDINIF